MIVQRNAWVVGSVNNTDPNAHSFQSPNRQRGEAKKKSAQEFITVEDDTTTITTQPAYHPSYRPVQTRIGEMISFIQTQDAFLGRAEESLRRMGELSALAQGPSEDRADLRAYEAEFAQLQTKIKGLGDKMFQAAELFHAASSMALAEAGPVSLERPAHDRFTVNRFIEKLYDPDLTAIDSAASASAAVRNINSALEVIADLRAHTDSNIQELHRAGERISQSKEDEGVSDAEITDRVVAEENTQLLRYDILEESRVAMLAQANALPQSTLRLLE